MAGTFSSVVAVGKLVGQVRHKPGLAQFNLNLPEPRKGDNNEYTYPPNVITVRVHGERQAERAAKLNDGDRVMVEGAVDDVEYNTVDIEQQPVKRKRLIISTYRNTQRGGSDNLQKTIIMGRVGTEPEFRVSASGSFESTTFSLALDVWRKGSDGADGENETVWVRVEVMGKRARGAKDHISKGAILVLEGKIENRNYDDTNGNKQTYTSFKTWEWSFIGAKRKDNVSDGDIPSDDDWDDVGGRGDDDWDTRASYGDSEPKAGDRQQPTTQNKAQQPYGDLDSEIPF